MLYAIFGLLCAAIAGLFLPPWYVVVFAYAGGVLAGFVIGLATNLLGIWLDKRRERKTDA
jgi:predicted permease